MKTFIFVAYWPKRSRQSRPSFARGVVKAESEEAAKEKVLNDRALPGLEYVAVVEFAGEVLIITRG